MLNSVFLSVSYSRTHRETQTHTRMHISFAEFHLKQRQKSEKRNHSLMMVLLLLLLKHLLRMFIAGAVTACDGTNKHGTGEGRRCWIFIFQSRHQNFSYQKHFIKYHAINVDITTTTFKAPRLTHHTKYVSCQYMLFVSVFYMRSTHTHTHIYSIYFSYTAILSPQAFSCDELLK